MSLEINIVDMHAPRATVRPALLTDIWGVHDTLIDALNASELPFPDPTMPYAIQHILDRIACDCVAVAVTPENRVVGCIILDTAHFPWVAPHEKRGTHFINEHFWVDPKFRRGGIASKLIDFAQNIAAAHKMPFVFGFSYVDDNTELKDRFIRSKGFRYVGGKFIWGME